MPQSETALSVESRERRTGRELVRVALNRIRDTSVRVGEAMGIRPDSPEVRRATDEFLLQFAERSIDKQGGSDPESILATDTVAIESAIELDAKAQDAIATQVIPIIGLEQDGYSSSVDEAVRRIHESYATIPGGHEAAPLLMDALDKLEETHTRQDVPASIEYVAMKTPMERSLDTLDELSAKLTQESNPRAQKSIEKSLWAHVDTITAQIENDPHASALDVSQAIEKLAHTYRSSMNRSVTRDGKNFTNYHQGIFMNEMGKVIDRIPNGMFNEMLSSSDTKESGFLKHSLKNLLIHTSGDGSLFGDLEDSLTDKVLRANGYESRLKFFSEKPEDRKSDALLDVLRMRKSMHLESIESGIEGATEKERFANGLSAANEYLKSLNLHPTLAMRILYGMRGRVCDGEDAADQTLNTRKLMSELQRVTETVSVIGTKDMKLLNKEAGIVNFGTIPNEQLLTTVGLLRGEEAVLDRLKSGDCSLLIRDATEDWNGAFTNTARKLSGSEGRNIVFEISSMGDDAQELDRRLHILNYRGVKPSTLIIAGHGSPGSIRIGSGWLGYRSAKAGEPIEADKMVSVANSKTMRRLFSSLKPSEVDGNTHIIIKSCLQASTETQFGVSTAIRVAREAGRAQGGNVKVYASDVSMNIRRGNEQAVEFIAPDGSSSDASAPLAEAKIYSVDGDGRLSKSTGPNVPLDNSFRRKAG